MKPLVAPRRSHQWPWRFKSGTKSFPFCAFSVLKSAPFGLLVAVARGFIN
ncbi:hypothetical protein GP5015_185 [gamma proteobacterium HTCC5015]|nr:hypothetical protein GP5015_185 [gamma proteobacterium HTCC5015]